MLKGEKKTIFYSYKNGYLTMLYIIILFIKIFHLPIIKDYGVCKMSGKRCTRVYNIVVLLLKCNIVENKLKNCELICAQILKMHKK